ncbi:hypothetical protein ABAC460_00585 [Asticcacaulis sp. AC460]|nr:hypothetical protein ABAC460_00585 [Asticcacaulis sp. AC460]
MSLIAIPLRDSQKANPPTPKAIRQAIRKAPEAKPDHAAYAVKALRNIMAYGTETGKIAAARLLLSTKYAHVVDPPASLQPPVIYYVRSGDPPPLHPDDYTSDEHGNKFHR